MISNSLKGPRFKKGLVLFLIFFRPFNVFACETLGSRAMWKFDQKKGRVYLQKIKAEKVCQYTTVQKPFNMVIKLFKNDTEVFVQKVFWSDVSNQEEIIKNKIVSNHFKTIDFKILKYPLAPNELDSYEVYNLENKIIGKGRLK